MKILMIIPHVGKGGDWVMVRTLTRVLRSAGHEVWIGSTSVDDAQRAEFDGHLIWELNRGAAGWVRSLPKIRHIPDDIDIIHAHSPQTTLFGWLLTRTTCRQAGLILTVHWWRSASGVRRWARRLAFRSADRVHCPSDEIARRVVSDLKGERHNVRVITHGVDTTEFIPPSERERKAFRSYFGYPDNEVVLLFTGRLNPEKNIGFILDFLGDHGRLVLDKKLRLLLAGDGPQFAELKRRVEIEGLSNVVTFAGYVNPVRSAYWAADILLLPSEAETFGLVVAEAALCGVCCLRSDSAGAQEQIIVGETGEVFQVGNYRDFCNKLCKMISCDHMLGQMGSAARRHVLAHFDIRDRLTMFEALYQDSRTVCKTAGNAKHQLDNH